MPNELPEHEPIFKWSTIREVRARTLPYEQPIHGKDLEVELTCGAKILVFRADDRQFYFCHGLAFEGRKAPGGAVSPFSGRDVQTILDNYYRVVEPEASAVHGDILVWTGLDEDTPHSAILIEPVVHQSKTLLDYSSRILTKNGRLPEVELTLERLCGDEFIYGDSFRVFRRK